MRIYGALSQNQQSFVTKAKFYADCGSLAPRGNNILAHAEAQRPAAEARGSLGVVAAVAVISFVQPYGFSSIAHIDANDPALAYFGACFRCCGH